MLTNATSLGLRTLAANPLRTFLSTLGVIIGSAALVAVLALGDGMERFAREQIGSKTEMQLVTITPRTSLSIDGVNLPRRDTVHLGREDLTSLSTRLGDRVAWSLVANGVAELTGIPGDSVRGARIQAIVGNEATIPDSQIVAGRSLTAEEADSDARVAVISPDLAGLFPPGQDALGRSVTLSGVAFEVIGIGGPVLPGVKVLGARIPFGSFVDAVPAPLRRPLMIVGTGERVEEMQDIIDTVRAWSGARSPDGLAIVNQGSFLEEVRQGMLIFKLLMGSITGISLIVGGIGIMNVLLASVIERTREIGIRRASGARRRDILAQFLAESVVVSGAGAAAGLLLGLAAAFGITALIRSQSAAPVHAAFTFTTVLIASSIAVVIGLVFGIYPALRAARLSPIDAIRTE